MFTLSDKPAVIKPDAIDIALAGVSVCLQVTIGRRFTRRKKTHPTDVRKKKLQKTQVHDKFCSHKTHKQVGTCV